MAPALGPAIPDEVIDKEPPFEGALVVQLPGNLYVKVRSHRYLTTPNIGHAVTWGYLLFGPTAWVITAHAEPSGAILYYVAALEGPLTAADLRVVPLDPATKRPPGVTGVFFPSNLLVTLPGGYAVQAVFTSDGGHFAPSAKAYAAFGERVEAASKGPQTPFESSVVRAAVFRIIDALLASGSDDDLEKAADNLAELSEAAFSLLDAETRIRYLTALVKAWTNEPQEKAIVEIFKSVGGREELNQIKKKLIEANIWNQLFDDLDSELWSLLIAIGRKFGDSASFSLASLGQLLLEANLIQPLPGVRLNEKGEPELSSEIFAEAYDAARSFVNKVKDFLESLWMFIAHPDKLIDSIGQLTKMIVTVELALVGYEPAIKAVKEAIAGIAQQALWALKG
ncbi:MAG: hypothetical protein JO110_06825, partial [Acetobacteraceae bacterium]|nr:hypothetical protein [Acetobacteraceae bacterium]